MLHSKIQDGQGVCLSLVKWAKGHCGSGGGEAESINDGGYPSLLTFSKVRYPNVKISDLVYSSLFFLLDQLSPRKKQGLIPSGGAC